MKWDCFRGEGRWGSLHVMSEGAPRRATCGRRCASCDVCWVEVRRNCVKNSSSKVVWELWYGLVLDTTRKLPVGILLCWHKPPLGIISRDFIMLREAFSNIFRIHTSVVRKIDTWDSQILLVGKHESPGWRKWILRWRIWIIGLEMCRFHKSSGWSTSTLLCDVLRSCELFPERFHRLIEGWWVAFGKTKVKMGKKWTERVKDNIKGF